MQIFNEIYVALNNILGVYGALNIDELHERLVEICQVTCLMRRMSLTLPTWLRNLLVLNRKVVLLLT